MAMNSSELTAEQARRIHIALYPGTNYLDRMGKAGFPPDDPLYLKAKKAYNAAQELYMAVHYVGCNGVGRPSNSICKILS